MKFVKATEVEKDVIFDVEKYGFNKVNGRHGEFMSAYFVVEINGEKVSISATNENNAKKNIGTMTLVMDTNGNIKKIKKITIPSENNTYSNIFCIYE